MPSGWKQAHIKEVGTVVTGSTPPTKDLDNYGDEFMFVSPADMGSHKYIRSSAKMVSKKGFDKGRKVPPKSTLFTCIGSTIGKIGMNEAELITNQQINSVIPNSDVDPDFIYYSLENVAQRIKKLAGQQAVPLINKSDFEEETITLPVSKNEQEKIAKILSTWDEAIEKLEKIIELEVAFKEIFIKKMMLDLEENSSTEFKKLSVVCKKITAGGTPSTTKSEYWGGDIPWMNSGEINHKFVKSVKGRITQKGLDNSSTKIIPKHSVLVALAGQGKTRGTVAVNEIDLCTNQSLAALISGDQVFYLYLYYNLDSRYDELRRLSTGDGGRGGLNLKIIGDVELPIPTMEVQKRIANAARALDSRIELLNRQKKQIQLQKQGLMQQLLTGRKRVKV